MFDDRLLQPKRSELVHMHGGSVIGAVFRRERFLEWGRLSASKEGEALNKNDRRSQN